MQEQQVRIIKKYPNRRLYDTNTSAYITLGDVKDLVLKQQDFKVVDAKSGEVLTRSILFQIILEEEAGGVPIFSADLLSVFIRIYGNATQGMLGRYLESSMKTFLDFQHRLQDQSRGLYGDNSKQMQADFLAQFLNFQQPAMQTMMSTYMDQSAKMMQQMQEKLQSQTRNIFTTGFNGAGQPTKEEH